MMYDIVFACPHKRAGRENEGELATTSLEFEFHLQFPCDSPSTELSARSRNEHRKHVPRVITSSVFRIDFVDVFFDADFCRYSN